MAETAARKTVLITGCQTGIGRATAHHFQHHGWNVVATMLYPDDAEDLAGLDHLERFHLDVENRESINLAVEFALDRFGGINVLVNNAGFAVMGIFEATTPEQTLKQFKVNVFGAMDVIRAVLPHMRANRRGTIINISSSAGRFAQPLFSLYAATKFAIEGFSEALAYELEPIGVTVKIVEPDRVGTDFGKNIQIAGDEVTIPHEYEKYFNCVMDTLLKTAESETMESVAAVIYEAASDNDSKLRYMIGNDFMEILRSRKILTDEQFMEIIKEKFSYKS